MSLNHRRKLSYFVNTAFIVATCLVCIGINHRIRSRSLPYTLRRNLVSENTPTSVETADIREGGPCIVFLVSSNEKDVNGLKLALKSLAMLKDNQNVIPTPVLIFSEDNLDPTQKGAIVGSTSRTVSFHEVNLNDFPSGFNPENEDANLQGDNITYCRGCQETQFWVSGIWKHPALEQYSKVMRMSTDSCFHSESVQTFPYFSSDQLVYHSQYGGHSDGQGIIGLMNFTEDYMSKGGHLPSNPMLWQIAKNSWATRKKLPIFNTKFEIVRKAWMQHPDVARWLDAVTEKPPHGIFRHQWSDSAIRYLTATMFSTNYRIDTSSPDGFGSELQCSEEDYLASI